jgi:predicted RNase H-like HicB family nuclease
LLRIPALKCWAIISRPLRGLESKEFFLQQSRSIVKLMKIKVLVHEAEEGGYWAEVPAIPGCATQGETFEELLHNLYEAVEGCLSVDVAPTQLREGYRVLEIAV